MKQFYALYDTATKTYAASMDFPFCNTKDINKSDLWTKAEIKKYGMLDCNNIKAIKVKRVIKRS